VRFWDRVKASVRRAQEPLPDRDRTRRLGYFVGVYCKQCKFPNVMGRDPKGAEGSREFTLQPDPLPFACRACGSQYAISARDLKRFYVSELR